MERFTGRQTHKAWKGMEQRRCAHGDKGHSFSAANTFTASTIAFLFLSPSLTLPVSLTPLHLRSLDASAINREDGGEKSVSKGKKKRVRREADVICEQKGTKTRTHTQAHDLCLCLSYYLYLLSVPPSIPLSLPLFLPSIYSAAATVSVVD